MSRPQKRKTPAGRPGLELSEPHTVDGAGAGYHSQDRQVLATLRQGRTLTALGALQQFGCLRLAACIHRLRQQGWPIEGHRIEVPARTGRMTRVACYRLEGGEQ